MWCTLLLWWKIPLGLLGVKLLVLAAKFAEQVVNRECFHLVVKPENYLQHFSQFMKGTISFLLALFNLGTSYTSFFPLWIRLGKKIFIFLNLFYKTAVLRFRIYTREICNIPHVSWRNSHGALHRLRQYYFFSWKQWGQSKHQQRSLFYISTLHVFLSALQFVSHSLASKWHGLWGQHAEMKDLLPPIEKKQGHQEIAEYLFIPLYAA